MIKKVTLNGYEFLFKWNKNVDDYVLLHHQPILTYSEWSYKHFIQSFSIEEVQLELLPGGTTCISFSIAAKDNQKNTTNFDFFIKGDKKELIHSSSSKDKVCCLCGMKIKEDLVLETCEVDEYHQDYLLKRLLWHPTIRSQYIPYQKDLLTV